EGRARVSADLHDLIAVTVAERAVDRAGDEGGGGEGAYGKREKGSESESGKGARHAAPFLRGSRKQVTRAPLKDSPRTTRPPGRFPSRCQCTRTRCSLIRPLRARDRRRRRTAGAIFHFG